MEYKEFIEKLDSVSSANLETLKKGYNECDQCFGYHIHLRELLGVISMKRVVNNENWDKDAPVTDSFANDIIKYFTDHQHFIIMTIDRKAMCSHLRGHSMAQEGTIESSLYDNIKGDDMSIEDRVKQAIEQLSVKLAALKKIADDMSKNIKVLKEGSSNV